MAKILVICGSTRKNSSNLRLINAILHEFSNAANFVIYDGLSGLPHFNPDNDTALPPATIIDFRTALHDADGILICTPEYAMGVPGTLKNALDWTVSTTEFSGKPVARITASSLGEKGHASLLDTLKIVGSKIPESAQLLISNVQTKVNMESVITDADTLAQVRSLMTSFLSLLKTIN